MILIDEGDLIFGTERAYHGRGNDPHFSMLNWISTLRNNQIGLHASIQYPTLILPQILSNFHNVLVHKTHSFEESKALRSLLNMSFRPRGDSSTIYSEKRKYEYQYEYLRVLEFGHALFNRADTKACFPIVMEYLNFIDQTHELTDKEIRERLQKFYPRWDTSPITVPEKSAIERDFRQFADKVKLILLIVAEYDELMFTAIQSSTFIEENELYTLLNKMVQKRYLIRSQEVTGVTRRHTYKITRLGLEKLLEYSYMKGDISEDEYREGKDDLDKSAGDRGEEEDDSNGSDEP